MPRHVHLLVSLCLVASGGCELVASFDREKIPTVTSRVPTIPDDDAMDASTQDAGTPADAGRLDASMGGSDAAAPDGGPDAAVDAGAGDAGPTDAGADAAVDGGSDAGADGGPSDDAGPPGMDAG